jgi:hypothetical protein
MHLQKPKQSRFPNYTVLHANDAVWRLLAEKGSFRELLPKWRPQTFYVDKPLYPRPNFFHVGVGVFVCDEKAMELATEPLEMSGEYLPIKVEGENGKCLDLKLHKLHQRGECEGPQKLEVRGEAGRTTDGSARILRVPLWRGKRFQNPRKQRDGFVLR